MSSIIQTGAPSKMTSFHCHSQSPRDPGTLSMSYRFRKVPELLRQLQRTIGRSFHIPFSDDVLISIRNKELWGEDAHVFNPDRWLNGTAKEKKVTSIGVYSNL